MALSIYSYVSYREYLTAYLESCTSSGESIRSVARRCGISSPNYLQQVRKGARNLTPHFARKLAVAANLNALQTEYLLALVALETARDERTRQAALDEMRRLILRSERHTLRVEELYSSWVNQVVWETAKTKIFTAVPASLRSVLRNSPSIEEVNHSLDYLRSRGFLTQGNSKGDLVPAPVDFEPSNDVRRVDLQRSHLRFLQLAQHRLHDPLHEREYQGLTMSMRQEDFEKIRQRCREFIAALNSDFAVDADGDEVVRIQLCAFKLTSSES
jgi:uncharacterized protein (TIGR02147 family)